MTQPSTLEFLKTEAAAGAVLAGAALVAILAANSPWAGAYNSFIHAPFTVQLGAFSETYSVTDWVKEGLMAVFFFVVGMEIKLEVLRGELANPRKLALPVLAALGGMVGPAAIYLLINPAAPPNAGWAVPTATDIALAIAALAAVSRGLPGSLRIFLLTMAVADDLGSILLIAVLFTHDLRLWELAGAALALAGMALLGQWRRAPYLLYAVGFVILWGFILKSGVSTSLAGVAAAMTVPITARRHGQEGVLKNFMDSLHPYVAFGVLPLFAFVSAGFSFADLSWSDLVAPVPLGIIGGMFLGKQLGVFGAAAVAIRLGLGRKPTAATWLELYGVCILCGVGFTMSLYIAALAFPGEAGAQAGVRMAITAGSVLSALCGMAVLAYAARVRALRGSGDPPGL